MPFDGQAFGQFVELLAHVDRCTDLLLLLRSSQLAIVRAYVCLRACVCTCVPMHTY